MLMEAIGIQVTYEQGKNQQIFALSNVDLVINKQEWISILGPSGSGKTTLLNVLAGLHTRFEGTVEFNGKKYSDFTKEELQQMRRNKIGYIFQDYRLFDQYTVLENVMMPYWPYENKLHLKSKAKEIIGHLGLTERIDALPNELSGGEKQRTAIARALLNEPDVLLCDEPTGNLDEDNRDHILEILKTLNEQGITILLVTHDPLVGKLGNREYYMRDGRLQEVQPT